MDYTELVSNLTNFQNTIDNSINDSDRNAFDYYKELIQKQKNDIDWQTAYINGDTKKTGGYGLIRMFTAPEEYVRQEKILADMKNELNKKEGWLEKSIQNVIIRNLAPALNSIKSIIKKENTTLDDYNKVKSLWDAMNSIGTIFISGIDATNMVNDEIKKNDQALNISYYISNKKPAEPSELINDTRLNYLQRQSQARKELPGSASQYYSNLAAAQKTKQINKSTIAFGE